MNAQPSSERLNLCYSVRPLTTVVHCVSVRYKNEEWLQEKYSSNTMEEIADMCDVTAGTISYWMDKFGIEKRSVGCSQAEGEYKNKEWLQESYIDSERSMSDIADEFGIGKSTVRYWLKKHEIPIRNKSDSAKIRTEQHPHTTKNAQTQDPTFYNRRGYEIVACPTNDSHVELHRLLATLMVDDIDELQGKHVHHKHGIEWLNYEDGLEILTPSEHTKLHWESRK